MPFLCCYPSPSTWNYQLTQTPGNINVCAYSLPERGTGAFFVEKDESIEKSFDGDDVSLVETRRRAAQKRLLEQRQPRIRTGRRHRRTPTRKRRRRTTKLRRRRRRRDGAPALTSSFLPEMTLFTVWGEKRENLLLAVDPLWIHNSTVDKTEKVEVFSRSAPHQDCVKSGGWR